MKYMQDVQDTMELFPGTSFQAINEIFGVLYVPLESMGEIEVTGISYNSIPKCYTYMDMEAAGKSGINRLHDHPYLKLRGKGTAVAVIDSGIDYQNEVFRNAGGSRIAYLWDQSIEDEEQNQSGRESEAENGDADNLPEEGDDITDTEVPYANYSGKRILTGHWIPRIRLPSCHPEIPTAMARHWQVLLPEIWYPEKILPEQRRRQP